MARLDVFDQLEQHVLSRDLAAAGVNGGVVGHRRRHPCSVRLNARDRLSWQGGAAEGGAA
jgi:hypothetical protein